MKNFTRTTLLSLSLIVLSFAFLTGCGDNNAISKETALETYLTRNGPSKLSDEEKEGFSVVNIESEGKRFEKERSNFRQKHAELSGFSLVTFKRVVHIPGEYFEHDGVVGSELILRFEQIMYRLKDDTYWRTQEEPLSKNMAVTPLSPSEQVVYDEDLAEKEVEEKVRIAEEAVHKAEESRQYALRSEIKRLEHKLSGIESVIYITRNDVTSARESVDNEMHKAKQMCLQFPKSSHCTSESLSLTMAKERLAKAQKYSEELDSKHKGLQEQITNLRNSL